MYVYINFFAIKSYFSLLYSKNRTSAIKATVNKQANNIPPITYELRPAMKINMAVIGNYLL